MKKQNQFQKFNALTKRKKSILLSVVAVFLCVCCVLPFAFSDPDESSRTANISTTGAPSETAISTPVTASTATAESTAASTAAPTPTQISLPACIPTGAEIEAARVVEIIDGDTIHVEINGATMPVRYIGIDTPERGSDFYKEASDRNRELLLGKEVLLVKDVSETDSFDRLLRYVFVEGQFVNEVLVEGGYAAAKEYPPDTACNQLFAAAQAQASSRGTGIWLVPSTEVVVASATAAATSTVAASTSACPTGCVEELPGCSIKGNINSEGEKIYHVPGGEFYSRTQINPSNGERWFCTIDEAAANGWRAPRN